MLYNLRVTVIVVSFMWLVNFSMASSTGSPEKGAYISPKGQYVLLIGDDNIRDKGGVLWQMFSKNTDSQKYYLLSEFHQQPVQARIYISEIYKKLIFVYEGGECIGFSNFNGENIKAIDCSNIRRLADGVSEKSSLRNIDKIYFSSNGRELIIEPEDNYQAYKSNQVITVINLEALKLSFRDFKSSKEYINFDRIIWTGASCLVFLICILIFLIFNKKTKNRNLKKFKGVNLSQKSKKSVED